jgi:hypothetical protein
MTGRGRTLCTMLVTCVMLGIPAWAGIVPAGALQFTDGGIGTQGLLSFTPGVGTGVLTIGAGNGGNGGLITDLFNGVGLCGGDCAIFGGYLTLSSGLETSGVTQGTGVLYTFGAGGIISIFGKIPVLGINSDSLLFTAPFLAGDTFGVVPSGLTAPTWRPVWTSIYPAQPSTMPALDRLIRLFKYRPPYRSRELSPCLVLD